MELLSCKCIPQVSFHQGSIIKEISQKPVISVQGYMLFTGKASIITTRLKEESWSKAASQQRTG